MPAIVGRNMRGSLEGIGKRLKMSSAARMRKSSRESIRSLEIKVVGRGWDYTLDVYSTLIQAYIDAYGLRPGTFPTWARGSRLFVWANRINSRKQFIEKESFDFPKRRVGRPSKAKGRFVVRPVRKVRQTQGAATPNASARLKRRNNNTKRFAYLAARSIFKRGIKPSFWNVKALEANQSRIILDLQNGLRRAVNEINR